LDAVVLLPTLPTKHQRQQHTIAVARYILLPRQRDVALILRLERRVDGVAGAQELMQSERKERLPVGCLGFIAGKKRALDCCRAGRLIESRQLAELFRRALISADRAWRTPDEPPAFFI